MSNKLATLQNYARKFVIPIDMLGIDFEILKVDSIEEPPENGVYVNGLFLEAARWDREKGCLADSAPKVLIDSLPIIWFKPSLLNDIKTHGKYNCPIYKTSARRGVLSTTGHSTNFVIPIRLASDRDDKYWVMRGVASL